MANNTTCEVANRSFFESSPVLFANTREIESAHLRTLRYGHSNNMTLLVSGTPEQEREYLTGILASSVGIFAFFMSWMLVILVLKCLGYKRVGFVSGTMIKRPQKPQLPESSDTKNIDLYQDKITISTVQHKSGQDLTFTSDEGEPENLIYEKQIEQWEKTCARRDRRLRRIRILVLLSGMVIIVCSVLLVFHGIRSLSYSLAHTREGLERAGFLADGGAAVIDRFQTRQNETREAVQSFGSQVKKFCPNVRNTICTNLTILDGCNFDDIPLSDKFIPLADKIRSFLEESRQIVSSELGNLSSDLKEIAVLFESASERLGQMNWAFWASMAFVLLLAMLTFFIMLGVVVAWREQGRKTRCWKWLSFTRNWFVVPLYVFLVAMSWIFSMVFVVGSTASGDFCYYSPDDHITHIIDSFMSKGIFHSLVYNFAVYYVNGCEKDKRPLTLELLYRISIQLGKAAYDLSVGLLERAPLILQQCGGASDSDVIAAAAVALQKLTCQLSHTLFDVQNYFSCNQWQHLYATVAYDAICYNGNAGLSWIATCMFVIVFFSMIMLTLRVAFYGIGSEKDEAARRRCRALCCRLCGHHDGDSEECSQSDKASADGEAGNMCSSGGDQSAKTLPSYSW